jgi:protocatechuate 3,4-dioxygenase beta subunit
MKKKSRRAFLKNTSLSVLSVAAVPGLLRAEQAKEQHIKQGQEGSCEPSTVDYYGQGPFYMPNAPFIQNGQLAGPNELGQRLIISGRVLNLDCTQALPNTEIDVWHADSNGAYDNTGYRLRGRVNANSQGFYLFETVMPGFYLNGASYRPAHIHFQITPPGFAPLITQLYFQGDPYIASDAAASMNSGAFDATHRIIPLNTNANNELEGSWDIVLDGNGVPIGSSELHLDRGMIYSAFPNPFCEELEIDYGVFQRSKVAIAVYDLQGRQMAVLDEQSMEAGKYSVVWQPPLELPKGHYFISIKINDLQVHYVKVLRE